MSTRSPVTRTAVPQIFVKGTTPIKFHLVTGGTYVTDAGGLEPRRARLLAKKIEVRTLKLCGAGAADRRVRR